MDWTVTACIVAASLVIVVIRPWRFLAARRHCPQCQDLLPRWNVWGWKEDWTCNRCGCRIEE
jgi:hypothetical protein